MHLEEEVFQHEQADQMTSLTSSYYAFVWNHPKTTNLSALYSFCDFHIIVVTNKFFLVTDPMDCCLLWTSS